MILRRPKIFRVRIFFSYFIGGFFLIAFGSMVAWLNHFFGTAVWIVVSLLISFWLAYTMATEPDDGKKFYGED